MASIKKYAGLPDLDDAGSELYQTPGLTDDASTVQTSTLRTESPTPSEDANENFDRTRFDREEARRRFEPAVVDAKDVNFSYAVGGVQKSYASRHRRRRRVRRSNGMEEFGDLSDEDGVEVVETLSQKLARLKREAEEVRLEIQRREKDDGEFQDTFEHQEGKADGEESEAHLSTEVDDLTQLLDTLQTSTRPKHESPEQELSRRLGLGSTGPKQSKQINGITSKETPPSSTITAITTFSDRISAIESALGLSTISPASNPTAILPTLDTLTSQINLLHSTITPKQPSSLSSTTTSQASNLTPQMPHLDLLQSRLHTLHQSASSLLTARKSAHTALSDLETVRLRSIRAADHLARYQNLANRRANRPTQPNYTPAGALIDDSEANNNDDITTRPASRGGLGTGAARRSTAADDARERNEIADELLTPLFLEDQAEKIKALYNVLPTIQDLQPLLPVVLERLRGLSVVHAGAADARADLDELEARLGGWEVELGKWRVAVEGVEDGIEDARGAMKENLEVVGGLVKGVEERVERLSA